MVHARDQAALDLLLAGRIGEAEFRRRIRYREEWGYPWSEPARLLRTARRLGVPVVGLDIPPRGGVADLALRDRVAAERLALQIGRRGRPGRLVVVFGEAHLARPHLPRRLAAAAPRPLRIVRVLHDLELRRPARGWLSAGPNTFARQALPEGARARSEAATYRRWARDVPDPGEIDLPLLVHGLIDNAAGWLGVDPRRCRLGPGRWLADLYPPVHGPGGERNAVRAMGQAGVPRHEAAALLERARQAGALYVPTANVMLVARVDLAAITLESCAFLRAAVAGRAGTRAERPPADEAAERALLVSIARDLGAALAPAGRPTRSAAGGRVPRRRSRRWLTVG